MDTDAGPYEMTKEPKAAVMDDNEALWLKVARNIPLNEDEIRRLK